MRASSEGSPNRARRSSLSGDRMLVHGWDLASSTWGYTWSLRELRTGGSTPLPHTSTYDLWGERLGRLDRDGSVWVKNLQTDAAWTQVRAKSGASYVWAPCTSPVTSSRGRCTRLAATASVPRRSGCATWGPWPWRSLCSAWRDWMTSPPATPSVSSCGDDFCGEVAVALADREVTRLNGVMEAAADGNTVAFVDSDERPAVFALPAHQGPAAAAPGDRRPALDGPGRPWTARIVRLAGPQLMRGGDS